VVIGVTAGVAARALLVTGVSAGAAAAINHFAKKSRGGPGKAPTGKKSSNRWRRKTSKKAPVNPNKKGPPPGTQRR
jgi:hypothetical protein